MISDLSEMTLTETMIFHRSKTFSEIRNIAICGRLKVYKLSLGTFFCPTIRNA